MRWLVAVVVMLGLARSARAEPDANAMKDYFGGEIGGGIILVGMGALGGVGSAALYVEGSEASRGAAYVGFGGAIVHTTAGIFVGASSLRRIARFADEIGDDPAAWHRREQRRMRGVSRQFFALKITEGVLGTAGLVTAAVVRDDHPQLAGAGLALAVEMAATFVFDVFAARRAHRYRRALDGVHF